MACLPTYICTPLYLLIICHLHSVSFSLLSSSSMWVSGSHTVASGLFFPPLCAPPPLPFLLLDKDMDIWAFRQTLGFRDLMGFWFWVCFWHFVLWQALSKRWHVTATATCAFSLYTQGMGIFLFGIFLCEQTCAHGHFNFLSLHCILCSPISTFSLWTSQFSLSLHLLPLSLSLLWSLSPLHPSLCASPVQIQDCFQA